MFLRRPPLFCVATARENVAPESRVAQPLVGLRAIEGLRGFGKGQIVAAQAVLGLPLVLREGLEVEYTRAGAVRTHAGAVRLTHAQEISP